MRIGDALYFAPGIKASSVSTRTPQLVETVVARLNGYYLVPASRLNEEKQAFAAGVLLTCCVDGMTRLDSGRLTTSRGLFISWVRANLPTFADEVIATTFYEDFRCGLVHGTQVCNSSEFNYAPTESAWLKDGVLIVNPERLFREISDALDRLAMKWQQDQAAFARLRHVIRADFGPNLKD